ncbi:MAG TPA: hypothetical protein VL463_01650 [Kofleriaceae bacterium]|nr:hypothetical protein [Kofleriaceae bacterium]
MITLAGLRWGIAVLVVTEAVLVATFAPFVVTGDGDTTLRIIGAASMLAAVPGLYSIGRAAPHMLELLGFEHSPNAARAARRVLAAGTLALVALPLF